MESPFMGIPRVRLENAAREGKKQNTEGDGKKYLMS